MSACFPEAGLAVGNGRSYGDVCLAQNGTVVRAGSLDRVLAFDRDSGVIRCEAGLSLGALLELALSAGWVLPVVPGTRYATVGGAVANDVHGKNHHRNGTFGCHVRELLLQRSNEELISCSPNENSDWFNASIGGLGLTGVILEVELQLQPVKGGWLDTETIKFGNLAEFFELSTESDGSYEYSVAWIDCLHREVRGHFSRANHSDSAIAVTAQTQRFEVPFSLPISPVNRLTLGLFNSAYYHRQREQRRRSQQSLYSFYYPLDGVGHWNRLYGKRGFRQYQCVVPADVVADLLAEIRRSGEGSFLAVLKEFGDKPSPGLLSFPRPGTTLALDFPWRGERTTNLFERLDALVAQANGAVYPAKDAHMTGVDFRRAYPAWEVLEKMRDPALKSLFWQRVTEDIA